jgi:hypothetical protein
MNFEETHNAQCEDALPLGHSEIVYDDGNKVVVWTRIAKNQVRQDTYHRGFQALLDSNAEEAKEFSRTGKLRDNVKLASVPLSLHMEWQAQGVMDDDKALAARLNDPDLAKFRVNSLRA